MPEWHHRIIELPGQHADAGTLEGELDKLGAEGYELVEIRTWYGRELGVFKKQGPRPRD